MRISRLPLSLCAALLLLSGCAGGVSLWPSLTADEPAAPAPGGEAAAAGVVPAMAAAAAPPPLPPALGTGNFEPRPLIPTPATGSFVGQRIAQLRGELAGLHARLSRHNAALQQGRGRAVETSRRYHTRIVALQARLNAAAGPGDPASMAEWTEAATELDALGGDIAALNEVANGAAAESTTAAYLLDSVRLARDLPGAVAADHRQLAALEGEAERTVELIAGLLGELRQDIDRESEYARAERQRLAALSSAMNNASIAGGARAIAAAPRPTGAASLNGGASRPLVVIRFDRPDVAYEQAVYTAASRALERRPDVAFDVVAVTAAGGTPTQLARNTDATRRHAEAVLRSLTNMGLPADRITLSATTSVVAQSNEVHIYVR
jgi:hypothetical protein